jgi:restriction endonuclease S subunit
MEVKPNSERELQGWSEVTVDNLKAANENALSTGPFGSSIGSRFFESTGVPVIRGSNLANDGHTYLIEDSFVFLSEVKASEFRRSTVFEGDLIFTCWGTINQVGLVSKRAIYPRYIISNKQMKFTPDPRKADSLFLFYLFSGPELQRQIRHQSIGSSVPGFNLGQLRSLRFRVPALSQQKAIAEALSDADAFIESLEQLIAKKCQIKQGALQELLTGKKRLPRFETKPGYKQTEVGVIPKEWEVRSLVDIAEIRSGIAKNSNIAVSNPVLVHYLRVANVQDGFLDLSEMSKIRMNINDIKRYAVLPGDVLMNEGGDLDKLGRGSMWRGEFSPCVHQNHVFVVRCGSRLSPDYLNVWTGATPARRYFMLAGKQTTNLASINKTALGQLPVALPPRAEQEALATILSAMDAEIAALEKKLAKAHQLKQGMMQELLTGRIRLV